MNGSLYAVNFPNGKVYIGITRSPVIQRLWEHKSMARRGKPGAVYRAMRKHGIGSCEIRTLARASWEYLLKLEVRAIAAFNTKTPNGYNMTDGGEGITNLSAEARARISAAQRGTARSAAQRAAISAAQKGRIHTPEHRWKAGSAFRGKKRSPEEIAKRVAARRAKYDGGYFAG